MNFLILICFVGFSLASPLQEVSATSGSSPTVPAVVIASPSSSTPSLLDQLSSAGYSDLKEAFMQHNLSSIINNVTTAPTTIFAPSNTAFKFLKESPWMKNMTNEMMKTMLCRIVVANKKLLPSDMTNEMMVQALSGERLRLNIYPRARTVNGVMFMAEPNVETHHVIVYRINRFPGAPMEGRNLVEGLTRRKERFSTLLRAIEVANLTDTLKKGGPFTLFAPTNDAFKAVPEAKLNKLMSSPSELKTVLLGHLVNGTYFLGGLMHSPDLHTLDGGSNKITFGRMNVTVDGATIILREGMIATNGAIHVIDHVLLPLDGASS